MRVRKGAIRPSDTLRLARKCCQRWCGQAGGAARRAVCPRFVITRAGSTLHPDRSPSPSLQRISAAATDHAAYRGSDANAAVIATRSLTYFLAAMPASTWACPHASAAA